MVRVTCMRQQMPVIPITKGRINIRPCANYPDKDQLILPQQPWRDAKRYRQTCNLTVPRLQWCLELA